MKHPLLFLALCLFLDGLCAAHAQNRWFGMPQADSTRWGWGLPAEMMDAFCLAGDSTGAHLLEFSYVATDTAELQRGGLLVVFNGYWLSRTEVTQAQWMHLMGAPLPHWTERGDNLPATIRDTAEAQAFLDRINRTFSMNFRLPSQQELDFAYRGGHFSEGYRFSGSNRLEWVAWSDGKLHPVAQKIPNELGFYDMDNHDGGFRVAYTRQQHFNDTSK